MKLTSQRAVLVVAHPGHEVLLHGWMKEVQPIILILTDGSGGMGASRIPATTEYTGTLGVTAGPIFGRFSDRLFYEKIIEQDFDFFNELADEISEAVQSFAAEYVICDSAEGYNPAHDICRLLVECAVTRASRSSQRSIETFEYPVVSSISPRSVEAAGFQINRQLDQLNFEGKLRAVEKYYPELLSEVTDAFAGERNNSYRRYLLGADGDNGILSAAGLEVFRSEYLRSFASGKEYRELVGPRPFYETCGEEKAANGSYRSVIRRDQHILPIADFLHKQSLAAKTTHA